MLCSNSYWMTNMKHKFLDTEYAQLCALERNKSRIYSNLFTIYFLGMFGGVFGYYFQDPTSRSEILAIAPLLILVWAHFIIFNFFYLAVVRRRLREIELNFHDSYFIKWYSDAHLKYIQRGIFFPLAFISFTAIVILHFLCYKYGYSGFSKLVSSISTNQTKDAECLYRLYWATIPIIYIVSFTLTYLFYRKR